MICLTSPCTTVSSWHRNLSHSPWFTNGRSNKPEIVPYSLNNSHDKHNANKTNREVVDEQNDDKSSSEEDKEPTERNKTFAPEPNPTSKKRRRKKKSSSRPNEPKITNLESIQHNAALVVHERIIMVAPSWKMSRSSANSSHRENSEDLSNIKLGAEETEMLTSIANKITPLNAMLSQVIQLYRKPILF